MINWRAIGRKGHYGDLTIAARATTNAVLFTASYGGDKILVESALVQNYNNNGAVSVQYVDGRTVQIPANTNMRIDCKNVDGMAFLNYGSQSADVTFFDAEGSLSYKTEDVTFSPAAVSFNDFLFHFAADLTTNSGLESNFAVVASSSTSWTSTAKFGSGGCSIGTGTHHLQIRDASYFPVDDSTDFCLDAWINVLSLAGAATRTITRIGSYADGISVDNDGAASATLKLRVAGTVVDTEPAASINIGTWQHIALTNEGGLLRLFIDGSLRCEYRLAADYVFDEILFGNDSGARANALSYVDEIRYTKSSAVYTEDFTTPTTPYL